MQEISLNILDIVENSIRAGARVVKIVLRDNQNAGTLVVTVADDGRGMTPDESSKAFDPFYTTLEGKRVGLGLPLLKESAELTGGSVKIKSRSGSGTSLTAVFNRRHLDCPPLGDIVATLKTLLIGYPRVDFHYVHRLGREEVVLDTKALSREYGREFREDIPAVCRVVDSLEPLLVHFKEHETDFETTLLRRAENRKIPAGD
ncbi:MAG: ATP-binding protein [Planctomycetota bacterium]